MNHMELIVKQIHKLLIKNKKTLAVAESCTGGLLSKLLTDLPGSSRFFLLGVVAYSNKAKSKILKISPALLKKRGAVSKETAEEMAFSARRLSGACLGIGITGIAGPAGASADKPKGTVFIALESKNKKKCRGFIFKGNRQKVRKKAALKALDLLKEAALR